jgi:hypothetical protein
MAKLAMKSERAHPHIYAFDVRGREAGSRERPEKKVSFLVTFLAFMSAHSG